MKRRSVGSQRLGGSCPTGRKIAGIGPFCQRAICGRGSQVTEIIKCKGTSGFKEGNQPGHDVCQTAPCQWVEDFRKKYASLCQPSPGALVPRL